MRASFTIAPLVYRLALLVTLSAAGLTRLLAESTNIFSTQFEFSQGYNGNFDLAGQNGWMKFGSGGNGMVTNFFPGQGQQAYVGFDPPNAGDTNLFLWQPINFSPGAAGMPLVRFTTLMSIEDSANGEFDFFQWHVLNNQTEPLIVIDFDVYETNVSYFLDGTDYVDTGVKFGLGATYTLTITMNFASNRWSATLNSTLLATNQPITTTGKQLTLGDVDAVWELASPGFPGDNFMLFDNYTITADAFPNIQPLQPRLTLFGLTGSGQSALRLSGQSGSRFAIEASTNLIHWSALKTNPISDGFFDYVDTGAPAFNRRLYRARWVP